MKVEDEKTIERGPDGKWLSSGNPRGRPLGSRNKLPELIYSRAAEVWQKHEHNLDKWAEEDFRDFANWCAKVMPRDVALSIEQRLPGNLAPEDWQLAMQVFQAVKDALPDASNRQPGEVLEFVLGAIRSQSAKLIEQ